MVHPSCPPDAAPSTMLDMLPVPLLLVNAQDQVVWQTSVVDQLWGISENQTHQASPFWSQFPQAWRTQIAPAYQAAKITRKAGYTQLYDQAHHRWWQLYFYPQAPAQLWLMFWDNTEQQQSQICIQAELTELRRWYDRFQLISQTSQQVFWEWDLQQDKTLWVGDTVQLFGYEQEEMPSTAQAWLELVHPEDREQVEAEWYAAEQQQSSHLCEYRVRCRDQTYRWVSDCSQYLVNAAGERHWLGVVADITFRKNAEAQAAQTELRFQNLVANLPGHVFRCANDPDWTIEYLSETIAQTVGYPASDFIHNRKRTFASIIHPEDQQYVYDTIQEIFTRQNHYGVEYRVIRADGQIRWFFESGQAIYDSTGQAKYIDGISMDITAQKQAELEIAANEARFRQLVEDIDVGVVVHAPTGEIILANARAAEILGLTQAQILGKSSFDPDWYVTDDQGQRLSPDQYPSSRATTQLTPIHDVVLGVNRPQRGFVWLQVTAEPLLDPQGTLQQVVVTLSDITQRKEIENALRYQSQREQAINRVIKTMRNSFDLAAVFQTTVEALGELLQVNRVVVVQYLVDQDCWLHLNEYLSSPEVLPSQGMQIPDAANPIAHRLKQGEIVEILAAEVSMAQDQIHQPLSEQFPGNWLIVPLQVDQVIWGTLTLHRLESKQAWQPSETSLVQVIADQLTVAIRQAELYQSLAAANEELKRLAITDELTQVSNRRYFDEQFAREWQRLLRDQAPISLVFCDVDDFKAYNDFYGHQAGDQCLFLIAQTLLTTARRAIDIVARYGGEEFVLVLPQTELQGAIQVVENIRHALSNLEIPHAASRIADHVTASFGISSTVPRPNLSPLQLLNAADQALYHAKKQGRNTYRTLEVEPQAWR